jgi:hypothetical protein
LLILVTCILQAAIPSTSSAMEIWLPFEKVLKSADIVCVADAIEIVSAPEPTAEQMRTVVSYRLRTIHVWKGEPPDTLILRGGSGRVYDPDGKEVSWMIACGGPRSFVPGRRYLVFASWRPAGDYPAAHSHTCAIGDAAGDIYLLQRTVGRGRRVALDVAPIQDTSYKYFVQQMQSGDSLARVSAVHAFRSELPDSSGYVLPVLVRIVTEQPTTALGKDACRVIARWAREDRRARKAFYAAMEGGDPAVRMLAVETQVWDEKEELQRRVLERRADPIPSIGASALLRSARLMRQESPPVQEYLESLTDTSAAVRIEALYALENQIKVAAVRASIEAHFADPDSEVAAVARKVIGRMGQR